MKKFRQKGWKKGATTQPHQQQSSTKQRNVISLLADFCNNVLYYMLVYKLAMALSGLSAGVRSIRVIGAMFSHLLSQAFCFKSLLIHYWEHCALNFIKLSSSSRWLWQLIAQILPFTLPHSTGGDYIKGHIVRKKRQFGSFCTPAAPPPVVAEPGVNIVIWLKWHYYHISFTDFLSLTRKLLHKCCQHYVNTTHVV